MKEESIIVTGDFYGGRRVSRYIQEKKFNELFGSFKSVIASNKLAITNLESPTLSQGRKIVKSGPAIKAPVETIEALKHAGFNLVTLANNHILDYGNDGLLSTLELLKREKIDYVGAGKDLEEARSIFYIEISNLNIAIINFCENEWSTTTNKKPGANPFDPLKNYYDIIEAKSKADKVIVIFHGGNELYSLPSPKTKERCKYFVDVGADIVICHHAHYYSGYQLYNKSLIFYGLGNFIFDNKSFKNPLWNIGIAVKLYFLPNKDAKFEIIPFRQCKDSIGIELLEGSEKDEVLNHMNNLNHIINDDLKLENEYDAFSKKLESQYLGQLQPYSNRFLYAAFKRGWLPSVFNKKKYSLIQNLIRCESHRDMLINILDKKNT